MSQAFVAHSVEEAFKLHEKAVDDVLKQKMRKMARMIQTNYEYQLQFGLDAAVGLLKYADGKIGIDELDYILNRNGIILDFITPNFRYKQKFGNGGVKEYITSVKDKEVTIKLYVAGLTV